MKAVPNNTIKSERETIDSEAEEDKSMRFRGCLVMLPFQGMCLILRMALTPWIKETAEKPRGSIISQRDNVWYSYQGVPPMFVFDKQVVLLYLSSNKRLFKA